MRRFRGRGGRRARRRTVWVSGFAFSGGGTEAGTQSSGIATIGMNATVAPFTPGNLRLAPLVGDPGAAAYGASNADILLAGGEECVLTRVVGDLWFGNGKDQVGGAQAGLLRLAICMRSIAQGSAIGLDLFSSSDLGSEDILWSAQVVVDTNALFGAGITRLSVAFPERVQFDVKARRRIAEGRTPFLQYQSATTGGLQLKTFDVTGYLRMLLRAPRR